MGTCGGQCRRPSTAGRYYDPFAAATLEILPRSADALTGLEEYSHLLAKSWFDRVQRARKPGLGRPEGRDELPRVSLFATRAHRRLNPLRVSAPRLLQRERCRLWVSGIDAWPGTPILDSKGYAPRDDLYPDATVPTWLTSLWVAHHAERGGQKQPGIGRE